MKKLTARQLKEDLDRILEEARSGERFEIRIDTGAPAELGPQSLHLQLTPPSRDFVEVWDRSEGVQLDTDVDVVALLREDRDSR